jgi:hypothetical protein
MASQPESGPVADGQPETGLPGPGREPAGPRYETAYELQQRTGHTDTVVCLDCGVFVMDRAAHTRFHSIMSSWAWCLAVLKTSHIGPGVHDRYDAVERIDRRRFDNWSADALAEVVKGLPDDGGDEEASHREH